MASITCAVALPEVEVVVEGDGGTFVATTTPGLGLWSVEPVPEGVYTVTPFMADQCFEHWTRGAPDGRSAVTIVVSAANEAANQSIQFVIGDLAVGDFDRNCRVDLADFAVFAACLNGPNQTPSQSDCDDTDLDGDDDIDLKDFAIWTRE